MVQRKLRNSEIDLDKSRQIAGGADLTETIKPSLVNEFIFSMSADVNTVQQ